MKHINLEKKGKIISGIDTHTDGYLLSHVAGAFYVQEELWEPIPHIIEAHGWTWSMKNVDDQHKFVRIREA